MTNTATLLCTDGSELALEALREALPVLAPAARTVVVTVTEAADPSLVSGLGFAGGVMSPEEQERLIQGGLDEAQQMLDRTVAALGLTDVETMILTGDAGPAICELAASLPASVIVMGTHGRRGIKRAVMGSTSDHVVRNAVCPVLVRAAGSSAT